MAAVGKVEASQSTSSKSVQSAKIEEQPNSIHNPQNKETTEKKDQPKKDEFGFVIVNEPKRNMLKVKAGYESRGSVDALAAQYKSTRAEIVKANDLKDADKIKEGQELIIPSKTGKAWDAYRAYQEKYSNAVYEAEMKAETAERAKAVAQRITVAKGEIVKAKEKGLDKKYEFSLNKEGDIVITLKSNMEVDDIVDDFKLNPGILRQFNSGVFGSEIKQEKRWHGLSDKSYNDSEAKKDLKLTIPPEQIGAGRTLWDKIWGD